MNLKKITSLICTVAVATSLFVGVSASAKAAPGTTPRNQTLYIDGLQWGAPASFNPMDPNPASFPAAAGAGRELTYETLFMFNQLTGKLEPLLGTKYTWSGNTLTVTMNKDAHWNDGKALTAADVAYTFNLGKKYAIQWKSYWDYLTSVTAPNATTVKFTMNSKNNKLMVLDGLQNVYILPQHIWSAVEKKSNNNLETIRKDLNFDMVGSGPYKLYQHDDTKITVVRDDNYWGKAKSAFGKLPAPKYIAHNIYKDNAAGDLAFKNGEVDVSQQFSPKVWLMWQGGAPIKTFIKDSPYYLPGTIPTLIYNTTKKGLDNASVRKAIAMSIDFKKISDIAMSGYSAAIKPSLSLITDAEQSVIDTNALKPLQYTFDVKAANKLLDSIGAKKGADGIRVLNGTRLGPWYAECPNGWSDWNASLEIVSQSAKAIGIDIRTKFPEAPVWTADEHNGTFDLIMDSPGGGASISEPWQRARTEMSSVGVAPVGQEAFWNYGRYKNAKADQLIAAIPADSNPAKQKADYTELNKIYLTDVPTVPLMYRPTLFYTVNESVWQGFPVQGDGSNIPPAICMDQAGIKALYKISAK